MLFGTDILMTYAVLGVVLLLFRNASDRTLTQVARDDRVQLTLGSAEIQPEAHAEQQRKERQEFSSDQVGLEIPDSNVKRRLGNQSNSRSPYDGNVAHDDAKQLRQGVVERSLKLASLTLARGP